MLLPSLGVSSFLFEGVLLDLSIGSDYGGVDLNYEVFILLWALMVEVVSYLLVVFEEYGLTNIEQILVFEYGLLVLLS